MAEGPRKYLPLFVAEATDQLAQLSRELVALEREPPGGPLFDSLFRRLHSVKGSAATLNLEAVVALSHAAEALVGRMKAAGAAPGRAQVDLLLEACDALAKEVQRAGGAAVPEAAVRELETRLTDAAAQLEAAPRPEPRAPRSDPPKPAADPALPRLDLVIALSRQCQAPGARALIVQRKLKALGTLLELDPAPQQLMQKKGGARLTALLATDQPVAAVQAALRALPEVETVEARVAPASPEAPASEPVAAPGELRVVAEPPDAPRPPEVTVRVRADALDQLLDQAAEVLHGIARLREAARKLPETHAASFEAEVDRLRRTARDLHGRVMNARLTPFSQLTEPLPRAVRELAHRLGKEVELELRGAEVELDRRVVEALGDPLAHLVRNAVDHGLEAQPDRLARGKPARGKLLVAARRERDRVYVDVEDDGTGYDTQSLRRTAVERGAITAERAGALSEQEAVELALLPGLSTRAVATDVSGRGVGLDAVKGSVEALGGALRLRSTPGRGSRVTLELPLMLSMTNLLLVQVGGELYGLPLARVALTTETDLSSRGGEGFEARSIAVMGQLVRTHSLAKLFGLPSLAPPGPRPFAVLEVDGLTFALSVDRLVGQEEAVLKPLFPPLDRIRGLAGTTVLGNGRPLLVLDPRGLHELAEASRQQKGAA